MRPEAKVRHSRGLSGCLLPSHGASSTLTLGAPYTFPAGRSPGGATGGDSGGGSAQVLRLGLVSRLAGLCPCSVPVPTPSWQEAQLPFPRLGSLCQVPRAFRGQRAAFEVPQQGAGRMRGLILGTTLCHLEDMQTHLRPYAHAPGGQRLGMGAPRAAPARCLPTCPKVMVAHTPRSQHSAFISCWKWRRRERGSEARSGGG